MTVRLHLNDRWSTALCQLPETGMGYQRVDVLLRDGRRVKDVLVFNAEKVEWPAEQHRIDTDDIIDILLSDSQPS